MQTYKEYLDQRIQDLKLLLASVDDDDVAFEALEPVLRQYEKMTDYDYYESVRNIISGKVKRVLTPAEADILWHNCPDPMILDGAGRKAIPKPVAPAIKPKVVLDMSRGIINSIMSNVEIDIWGMDDDLDQALEYEITEYIDDANNTFSVLPSNFVHQIEVMSEDEINAVIIQLDQEFVTWGAE